MNTKGKINTAFLSIIAIALLGFIALWFIFLHPDVSPKPQYYKIQIVDSAEVSDSVINKTEREYTIQQIDSIKTIVQHIDDQYQQDIDTMINKGNAWLGFWLTLMSVLIAVFAFFNWHQNSKYSEEFDKIKDDYIKLKEKFSEQNRQHLSIANNLFEEKKSFEDYKRNEIAKIKELAKISSLSECIINIPDPAFLSKEEDRKEQVVLILESIQKSYSKLVNIIATQYKEIENVDESTNTLIIILIDIKIALLSSQRIFSKFSENITFYTFLKELTLNIQSFRKSGILIYTDINKLRSISKNFANLIVECKKL